MADELLAQLQRAEAPQEVVRGTVLKVEGMALLSHELKVKGGSEGCMVREFGIPVECLFRRCPETARLLRGEAIGVVSSIEDLLNVDKVESIAFSSSSDVTFSVSLGAHAWVAESSDDRAVNCQIVPWQRCIIQADGVR